MICWAAAMRSPTAAVPGSMVEMRALMGGNLLNLPHERWLPRRRALQPMFTKRQVARYAGHMAAAAQGGRRRLA